MTEPTAEELALQGWGHPVVVDMDIPDDEINRWTESIYPGLLWYRVGSHTYLFKDYDGSCVFRDWYSGILVTTRSLDADETYELLDWMERDSDRYSRRLTYLSKVYGGIGAVREAIIQDGGYSGPWRFRLGSDEKAVLFRLMWG